jgi:hypothetical protein
LAAVRDAARLNFLADANIKRQSEAPRRRLSPKLQAL